MKKSSLYHTVPFHSLYSIFRELLQLFVAAELIHWATLCQQYETVLRSGDGTTPATNVFTIGKYYYSWLTFVYC